MQISSIVYRILDTSVPKKITERSSKKEVMIRP